MRRGALATLAAPLAALALLAGCGGDDAKTTADTNGRTTPAADGADGGARPTAGDFDPQEIFRRDASGVVTILAADRAGGSSGGLGSGFVVSDSGEVVTNAHVITSGEGAAIRKAAEVFVRFADGNQVEAKIVGFDPFSDVALVKVDPDGLKLRLRPPAGPDRHRAMRRRRGFR